MAGRLLAASCAACSVVPAWAGGRDEDLFIRPEDQRTVLFGSLDAGRSLFVSGGAKQTLVGPLDRTGFVSMETTGFGLTHERYRNDVNLPVRRFTHQSSVLAGYQWALNGFYIAAYAGPEVEEQQVAVAGRVYRLSEPRLGARGQLEIWANPTAATMVTATVVAGSTRGSLWSRVSAGYDMGHGAYLGPELTVYVTPTYRETRWGGHVTGIAMGPVQLRVSGGWMTDDDHAHGSPYLGLTAWMRM